MEDFKNTSPTGGPLTPPRVVRNMYGDYSQVSMTTARILQKDSLNISRDSNNI